MPIRNPNRDRTTGLTPLQAEFLEWLTDPDHSGTQADWARAHNVATNTVSTWKREDPFFADALRKKLIELNLDPLSVSDVISGLRKKAATGDTQAAQAILAYMKYLVPDGYVAKPTQKVEDLTDEELLDELEQELAIGRADLLDA